MRPAAAVLLLSISAPLPALEPPGQALRLERSRGGLAVVAAELGGETLRLALDTGTSRSMIAGGVAARLGLAARARFAVVTAAGPERTALCAGPLAVRVAGVALAVDCLGWIPAEPLLAGAEDVDGLLGADALSGVDLWIDLGRGRARVAPAGALAPWIEGERLPLQLIERRPAVTIALPELGRGAPARLVLDSGADRTLLFGELARRAARSLGGPGLPGRLSTAAGGAALDTVALGEVRAGAARIDGGHAGLLPAVLDRGEDGLLPLAALGPVLLDLAGGSLVVGARLRARPVAPPPGPAAGEAVAALPD